MICSFREVIELWDTPDELAADIGASIAAARKWRWRNAIPAEWWTAIIETDTARENGVTAEVLAGLAARRSTSEGALDAAPSN